MQDRVVVADLCHPRIVRLVNASRARVYIPHQAPRNPFAAASLSLYRVHPQFACVHY